MLNQNINTIAYYMGIHNKFLTNSILAKYVKNIPKANMGGSII